MRTEVQSPVTRGSCNYDISGNASGIVTVGPDPIVGNLLNRVYNEIYAARVKDRVNNNSVSVISQTVTNYTDPHIYFAWAAVLEALHGPTDSDNFTLMLTDDTTHRVLYAVTSGNNSTADSAEAGTLAMVGTGAIVAANWLRRRLMYAQLDSPLLPGDMSNPQNDTGSGDFRRRLFHESSHVTL